MIEHGSGAALTRCVGFDAEQVSGEELIRLSGIQYAGAGYGGGLGRAVCQIDGEPASYPAGCFDASTPRYWALFLSRGGGAWVSSNLGVSSQVFRDGDAEGFRFEPQSGAAAPPPSPAGVCAAAPSPPPAGPASATPPSPVPPLRVPKTAVGSPEVQPSDAPIAVASPGASPSGSPPALVRASGGGGPAPPTRDGTGWAAALLAAAALAGLILYQALRRRLRH